MKAIRIFLNTLILNTIVYIKVDIRRILLIFRGIFFLRFKVNIAILI